MTYSNVAVGSNFELLGLIPAPSAIPMITPSCSVRVGGKTTCSPCNGFDEEECGQSLIELWREKAVPVDEAGRLLRLDVAAGVITGVIALINYLTILIMLLLNYNYIKHTILIQICFKLF